MDSEKIYVQYWREDETVVPPRYTRTGDACMDVCAWKIDNDYKRGIIIIHTGLHFAVPTGYEMQIRLRSSATNYRYCMINAPGTLDSNYRGELLLKLTKIDKGYSDDFPYVEGDRCMQINIHKIPEMVLIEQNTLQDLGRTNRDNGGFGSSGR